MARSIDAPIKVLHVITDLKVGGAELALHALLKTLDATAFPSEVVSLKSYGEVGKKIESLGVPVHVAGFERQVADVAAAVRLVQRSRAFRPSLIQTWMYHADLLGGVAARFAGSPPVVWGLRQASADPFERSRSLRAIAALSARASHKIPSAIVSASEAGARLHRDMGYASDKLVVIPNGIDCDLFSPSRQARSEVREELGLRPDALLLGAFGRHDPDKDHDTLLEAVALLVSDYPDLALVMAGAGLDENNADIRAALGRLGLVDRVHLLGLRDDMPRLTAALDLGVSSSSAEGFPNVVGEMMASGVPCVVTHAGDSALVVGGTGDVVSARDATALSAGCRALLALGPEERAERGRLARTRIQEMFDLRAMAERYAKLYVDVIEGGFPCAA